MALSVADCDAMIAAAAAARKSLGVISQRRWYPSVRRIREAIDSGALGKPSIAQVTILGWRDEVYYNADPWRGSWALEGGGVLVNQAPHQLDLLAWFMGPAKEIAGLWDNVNHPYIEVEDTAVAAIRFANGGMGSVLLSNSQKPGIYAKVHIHGSSGASAGVQTDGGAMFIAGMSGVLEPPYNDLWTIPGQESMLPLWKAQDEAYFSKIDPTWYFFALQIAEFSESARAGRAPAVTGEDGRETVRIFEGIYRRALISSSETWRCSFLAGMSMVIWSPSRTTASGPPSAASGETWPTKHPLFVPENLPSVTSAVLRARPCRTKASLPCTSPASPARPSVPRSE